MQPTQQARCPTPTPRLLQVGTVAHPHENVPVSLFWKQSCCSACSGMHDGTATWALQKSSSSPRWQKPLMHPQSCCHCCCSHVVHQCTCKLPLPTPRLMSDPVAGTECVTGPSSPESDGRRGGECWGWGFGTSGTCCLMWHLRLALLHPPSALQSSLQSINTRKWDKVNPNRQSAIHTTCPWLC